MIFPFATLLLTTVDDFSWDTQWNIMLCMDELSSWFIAHGVCWLWLCFCVVFSIFAMCSYCVKPIAVTCYLPQSYWLWWVAFWILLYNWIWWILFTTTLCLSLKHIFRIQFMFPIVRAVLLKWSAAINIRSLLVPFSITLSFVSPIPKSVHSHTLIHSNRWCIFNELQGQCSLSLKEFLYLHLTKRFGTMGLALAKLYLNMHYCTFMHQVVSQGSRYNDKCHVALLIM